MDVYMYFNIIFSWLGVIIVVLIILGQMIKVIPEYERGVVLRLGRLVGAKGPGIIFLIPIVDKMVRMSLRVVTLDVPSQEVITRDNVPIKVNAVVYFRIVEPAKTFVEVQNYILATSQISQTTLRSVLGEFELDELLAQREKINQKLQQIIDEHTDPWGIKVITVEVKDLELPEEMKRAMAKQAEAERERRAKVINAEGEYQAAEKLSQAAEIIGRTPVALQLRFLQTLVEVATENNSTTIFPVPIDLFEPFLKYMKKDKEEKNG